MASFKVPCPSCEAPVLIKDPKLVGTKVECPKCKYRFKVEEPAAATGTGDAAKDKKPDKKDGKDKKDKKEKVKAAGGKNKKLIPIIGGVVGLLVLGVVGYAFFGGSGKNPPKQNPFPNANKGTKGGGTDTPEEKKDEKDKKEDKKEPPPPPPVGGSDKVTTNLLPGQSVSVYRFNMSQLRGSPAYGALLDQTVGQMFQDTLGFGPDDVEMYLHSFAGDTRDPFGVIKLKVPAKAPDLLAKMHVQIKPKAVKKYELYSFRSAPLLVAVSNALAMRALFGDLYTTVPMAPTPAQKDKPFGLCVYDTQHVFVGDYALLERFLGELDSNGYPPFKSEMADAPKTGPVTPVTPKEKEKEKGKDKGKEVVPVAPPAAGEKSFTSVDSYRTIEFPLKDAMDRLEADRTATPTLVYAEKFDARHYDPKLLKKEYQVLATTLDPIANRAKYISGCVTTFSTRQLVATVRITFGSEDDARDLAKEKFGPGLTIATEVLKLYLTTPIDFRDNTLPGAGTPGVGTPGMGMPGVGTPMPPPMPKEGRPMGMGPPGTGLPGMGPVDPKDLTPAASHIDLSLVDKQLIVAIDITWTDVVFSSVVAPRMLGVANQIKGKMAVFSSESGPHLLAAVGPRSMDGGKSSPRGTWNRVATESGRMGQEYPPLQRVSLFADLLPYMGRGQLANAVNKSAAWYDEKNLSAGGSWVPELLVPSYPQSAWRATSPDYASGYVFGATNYVAISGTGLNSARFNPNNPDEKKKMGMTGYGWGSKAEEVTDGLANTIFLMQTPPGLQQPWIAGGGATVRGFDENDPMFGFKYNHGGKQGSYALMGDGSVRFIPANIDKKVLLALGTRAGGDNDALADVNKAAPLVDPPKPKTVDLKTDPKSPVVPPKPEPGGKLELAPAPREKK